MFNLEPGSLTFTGNGAGTSATIYAAAPVNRDALQNYIANIRQTVFHGVQVPFTVIHIDADTGEQRQEHIPGCATCSI